VLVPARRHGALEAFSRRWGEMRARLADYHEALAPVFAEVGSRCPRSPGGTDTPRSSPTRTSSSYLPFSRRPSISQSLTRKRLRTPSSVPGGCSPASTAWSGVW
jgi:hypothetical protein